jgi:hypothetical protein
VSISHKKLISRTPGFYNQKSVRFEKSGVVGMYGFHKLSSMYHGLEQAAKNKTLGMRTKELEELTWYLLDLSERFSEHHDGLG